MVRRVLFTTFLYLFGVVPPIVLGALAGGARESSVCRAFI